MAQARGRLVEQQHRGLAGERAGDLDDPLLPQGQRRRAGVRMLAEPAALDLLARLGKQRRLFATVEPEHGREPAATPAPVRSERDVLQHAARAEQPHVLEGAAEAERREFARGAAGHGLSHQAHLARAGIVDSGDHVEEGALAGAVGADEGMDLAGLHIHRHRVVRHQAAEALGDLARFEQHLARGRQAALGKGRHVAAGLGARPA